jgi:OmpA-OmpF porin, OOP family
MSVKKITLLFSICFLFSSIIQAQQKNNSTKTSQKYKWAAGVTIGNVFVNGDVPAIKTQLSLGVNVYKPFADWFGVKFKYVHGNAKGLHWLASENFAKNTAWSGRYAAPVLTGNGVIAIGYIQNNIFIPATQQDVVYYNYKTSINSLSLSAVFTLPIPFENPKLGIHFNTGIGALFYKAKVDALNGNGTYALLFKEVFGSSNRNSKEIISALKKRMDGKYETAAEAYKKPAHFTYHFGYGISYKIKKRFEVGIEKSYTFIKSDLLDGQRWQEYAYGDAVLSRDFDNLRITSINLSYFF